MQLPCSRLDYSPFAAVTFGYAMSEPALHMCGGNMTQGIQIAAEQLTARGYRRIGAAVTVPIHRARGADEAGSYSRFVGACSFLMAPGKALPLGSLSAVG